MGPRDLISSRMSAQSDSLNCLSSSGGSGKVTRDIGYYVIMSANKKALVTGAAARIGAAIAETLHQRGCDVVLHCNSKVEKAQQLAERLNAVRDDSAFVASADLSDPTGIGQLAGAVKSRFDRLDILVNNASRFDPTAVVSTLARLYPLLCSEKANAHWALPSIMEGINCCCCSALPPRRALCEFQACS